CRNNGGIRLFSEQGQEWTSCFPYLIESLSLLPVKSCVIDGELVRCDEHGNTRLEPPRDGTVELGASFYVFDLLEVNGFDLRSDPIEERKRALGLVLLRPPAAMRLNEPFDRCGEQILRQIGQMG